MTDPKPGGLRARIRQAGLPGLLAVCLLFAVAVAGTGCTRSADKTGSSASDREAKLRQIASDYARSEDLTLAQAALDQLGVANPSQLLLSLTEADISAGRSRDEIEPLAQLVDALGIHSPKLVAYLAPTATPTATPVPPTATALPPTATPLPTATSRPLTPTLQPTVTPTAEPQQARVVAASSVNLRSGPGRAYPVVGQMRANQELAIIARNANGDWWQLDWDGQGQAWVAGTVVSVLGPIDTVQVAKNIPTPPPQPTATPRPTAGPTATPQPAGPDFRLISRRLYDVYENGGFLAGTSVNCGGGQILHVYVQDAAGNLLNGVTVREEGGEHQELVSGSKGPGMVEYNLYWPGKDVTIVRDVDGHSVTSDTGAAPTNTDAIPFDILISAKYCTDAADCTHFVSRGGCNGHYSWDITFRRSY